MWKYPRVIFSPGFWSVNSLPDSRSNAGVLTTPLGFKGLTVGLTHPLAADPNLWIEANKCEIDDKCQLYSEVPQTTEDYAEVNMLQRGSMWTFKGGSGGGSHTSAAYASTTLVLPPSANGLSPVGGRKLAQTICLAAWFFDIFLLGSNEPIGRKKNQINKIVDAGCIIQLTSLGSSVVTGSISLKALSWPCHFKESAIEKDLEKGQKSLDRYFPYSLLNKPECCTVICFRVDMTFLITINYVRYRIALLNYFKLFSRIHCVIFYLICVFISEFWAQEKQW